MLLLLIQGLHLIFHQAEDVLEHTLQEVSLSNLKKAGPELLSWDVQPFIMHKRASLPKCALEQLKGSLLEEIPVLDGDKNVPTSRFDDSDDENGNQEVNVNQDGTHIDLHLNAKKFKQDAICTIQTVEHIPIGLHCEEQVEDEFGMFIKVTEIEGNNLGKDSQAGEGDQDVHVASRTLEQSNAVSHVELQDNPMENVQNADADLMVVQKYGDRPCQNVVMDESNYVENGALQKGSSGDAAKAEMEHPCVGQLCENEDERFNIALKKSLFLSFPVQTTSRSCGESWPDRTNFCVKCNQNGEVLVCNSSGCPLLVHESCLDSAARFDDKGNFYCPLCTYSLSISEYLEAKDKTSLARKELAAFMELCSKELTEEQRKLQGHSILNGDEEFVAIQESGHLGEIEHNFISQNREVNHGPSASCLNGNKLCVEEKTSMCGAADVEVEGDIVEELLEPQITDPP
ncbi:hypothetical protein CRYUN_Cryun09bG0069800 [Craigia yunnanensis]